MDTANEDFDFDIDDDDLKFDDFDQDDDSKNKKTSDDKPIIEFLRSQQSLEALKESDTLIQGQEDANLINPENGRECGDSREEYKSQLNKSDSENSSGAEEEGNQSNRNNLGKSGPPALANTSNESNAFEDSDDEIFSQLDEEQILRNSQNSKNNLKTSPQSTSQSTNDKPSSPEGINLEPLQHQTQNQIEISSSTTTKPMAPPLTTFVPKRPSTSPSSNVPSASSTPGGRQSFLFGNSQVNSEPQSVSTTQSSSSIGMTGTESSREAFFANWESDELSSYEKRLKTIKRRFPGPAGLLPVITRSEAKFLDNSNHPLSQQISKIISSDLLKQQVESANELEIMPSDREILKINKAPWRELIKSLKLNPKDPNGLLSLMSIRWVRKKVCKHPVTTKIPFLAMVVQEEPEVLGSKKKLKDRRKNPSIKLMDPTGTIVAAMDAKFVELYGAELHPGTAIAVKNSGFLRFRRQVILTITRKNIICMTSMKNKEDSSRSNQVKFAASPSTVNRVRSQIMENVAEVTETKEGVRIMKFCDFSPTQAIEDYNYIQNAKLDEDFENFNVEGSSKQSSGLFSTVGQDQSRPFTVSGTSRNIMPPGSAPRNVVTGPTPPKQHCPVDYSVFGDEDDEDLMLALETVDFLMDTDDNETVAHS